jgi:lysozyme
MISCVEDYLIFEEGERFSAYQDSLGYWTIGVGHLIDTRKGGSITPEISHMILAGDIAAHESYLRFFPWYQELSQVRKAVLISMLHQLGSLQAWPHFLIAVAQEDWEAAAAAMRDSLVAKEQSPERWARASDMMEFDRWPVISEQA